MWLVYAGALAMTALFGFLVAVAIASFRVRVAAHAV